MFELFTADGPGKWRDSVYVQVLLAQKASIGLIADWVFASDYLQWERPIILYSCRMDQPCEGALSPGRPLVVSTDDRTVMQEYGLTRGVCVDGRPLIARLASGHEVVRVLKQS